MFLLETAAMILVVLLLVWSLSVVRRFSRGTSIETLLVPNDSSTTQINIVSGILLVVTVAIPLCGLAIGGTVRPWNHPLVITLLAISPFVALGFYYYERYITLHPTVPVDIVSRKPVARVLVIVFGVVFALNIVSSRFLT